MTGKNKCKILKQIRKQIAADNDIEFVTSECKYQGDCSGTCPKCEAEVRYLEQELAKRQQLGKAVTVAGIAATLLVSTAGCLPSFQTAGDPLPPSSYQDALQGKIAPPEDTTAGVPVYPTETTEPPTPGALPYETEPTDGELMGEPAPARE